MNSCYVIRSQHLHEMQDRVKVGKELLKLIPLSSHKSID